MYSHRPNLIIGFHGCDKKVALQILNNPLEFKHSENPYDWLGHGFYFWENNLQRALDFAKYAKDHPEVTKGNINEPFVLGAVIELRRCLDLFEAKSLDLLKSSYQILVESKTASSLPLPENKPNGEHDKDNVRRLLDCAVIQTLHKFNEHKKLPQFDSVRAPFIQGDPVYTNGSFHERNNIQICIRNINCIKGFFLPRNEIEDGFSHFRKLKPGDAAAELAAQTVK